MTEVASTQASGRADAADAHTDDDVAVKGFLAAWDTLDIEAALTFFEAGAVHHDSTTRSGGAGQDVPDFLAWAAKTADAFRTEVHEVIVVEGVVLTERTDQWTIDGREIRVPTIGMFDIDKGRIRSWADTTCRDFAKIPAVEPAVQPAEPVVRAATALEPRAEIHEVVPEPPVTRATPATPATPIESSPVSVTPAAAIDTDLVATLEEQVHEWRRRATIWQERALTAETIGDVLRANVDDLRRLVKALESRAPEALASAEPGGLPAVPEEPDEPAVPDALEAAQPEIVDAPVDVVAATTFTAADGRISWSSVIARQS